jgi:hypothetical protein
MILHKITEIYEEWFGVCSNITSKFCTIAIFKSFVKQNNDSNTTCGYIRSLSLYQTSLVQMQRFMSWPS